jgi:hypothetical protein
MKHESEIYTYLRLLPAQSGDRGLQLTTASIPCINRLRITSPYKREVSNVGEAGVTSTIAGPARTFASVTVPELSLVKKT